MITVINGPTKIVGQLRTYNCGSGSIFLNLVPDMEVEIRNVHEQIPIMMKRMGLPVLQNAVIDVNRGTIHVDKTTQSAKSTNPAQFNQQTSTQEGARVLSVKNNTPEGAQLQSTPNRPSDNQPPGAENPNTPYDQKTFRKYMG